MKIKWGALVVDGRNKIGGHVASKNRAGAYLRTKVTPVNPQSSFQSAVRSVFAAISQAWGSLTQAQRNAWNNAVESWSRTDIFGDIKNPSGFNLHQQLNINMSTVEQSFFTSPPEKIGVESPAIVSLTGSEAGGTLDLVWDANTVADTYAIVYATGPVSPGTTFVKSQYRKMGFEDANAETNLDIATAWEARHGTITQGDKVFAKLVFINALSGEASALQTISAVVGA